MEDQKQHLDEIFHQRLHNAEVPPPPFVWPAVEQALQQKRRRKPLAFWWFAAAGTLVFGAVALWMLNSQETAQFSAFNPPAPTAAVLPQETVANPANTTEQTATNASFQASNPVGSRTTTTRSGKTVTQPLAYQFPAETSSPMPQENNSAATAPTVAAEETTFEFSAVNTANLPALTNDQTFAAAQKANLPTLKPFKSGARRKKIQPRVCYDFNRHPSALLIDVYAGPSIAQRSLTSRQEDEPYLKQRLATESRDLAFNAGLRASLMFSRNFLVRTGLHYDQFTEVFEYIDPTSVTYTLKFTPGNPIPDTIGVQYGENYLKTYNRYGSLDIPLMVGVEMRSGRSGFNINAGISANVLFWKRGAIIDPLTNEPARFGGPKANISEEVFRTRLSMSAGATVQWYWHITPHTRLFVEPSFRQVLRPVTLQNHPVDQRYSILGLRLGSTMIF